MRLGVARALSRRTSTTIRESERYFREGTLQQQHVATIEWYQTIVMSLASLFGALCWLVVVPVTGDLAYGWILHLLCLLACSSNADLDFDEFFRKRKTVCNLPSACSFGGACTHSRHCLQLHGVTSVGATVAILLGLLAFIDVLPCIDDVNLRSVLSLFAWLPALYQTGVGVIRIFASFLSRRFAEPKVTTMASGAITGVMYSWLINNITVLYFCNTDFEVHLPKVAVIASFFLAIVWIQTSDADGGIDATFSFFKLIHLWTFCIGVSFIAEGIEPTDVVVANRSPAWYLIALGLVTAGTVVLIRLYPDHVYGLITSFVRNNVKLDAALAMRKPFQGGHWNPLAESPREYELRGRRRFVRVALSNDGMREMGKLQQRADFFVVCTGVHEGRPNAQAITAVLRRHSRKFRQEHMRDATYWIWDACTSSMEDMELMPISAALCDKALVVISRDLMQTPLGLLQLFSAFLVHCEPARVEVEVSGDISSLFSCSVDRVVETTTTSNIVELLRPGGFVEDEELTDIDWWTNWELASQRENLTDAKLLIRIVGSYSSVGSFTADLRDRLSTVVRLTRSRFLSSRSSRHEAEPTDFSDILATLADTGVISRASATDHPLEIPRREVELGRKLGAGQFGEVWQATMKHRVHLSSERASRPAMHSVATEFQVAVKTLIDTDSEMARGEFLREAAISWTFRDPNVIEMFGVVTQGYPLLLILELCPNGELKSYLEREFSDHSAGRLFELMHGIARGMAHLASHHFVHRDLAARNVLLSSTFEAKVADFGMGRDLKEGDEYQATNKCMLLPIRWTDPAVVDSSVFSEFTDVWSYGITCIEIWTSGRTPYKGWTTAHLLEQLQFGYRLPKPDSCPEQIYNSIIAPCWFPLPADSSASSSSEQIRPTFRELVLLLDGVKPTLLSPDSDAQITHNFHEVRVMRSGSGVDHEYEYQEPPSNSNGDVESTPQPIIDALAPVNDQRPLTIEQDFVAQHQRQADHTATRWSLNTLESESLGYGFFGQTNPPSTSDPELSQAPSSGTIEAQPNPMHEEEIIHLTPGGARVEETDLRQISRTASRTTSSNPRTQSSFYSATSQV
eukprot:m.259057 g.259057  ORF g.259057 m.259057 type:complete len:1084 (+) comp15973_c0_seq8:214-3465(+)